MSVALAKEPSASPALLPLFAEAAADRDSRQSDKGLSWFSKSAECAMVSVK